jgi:2-methylcitrate dehydratase PrpD
MGVGLSKETVPESLTAGLGSRWPLLETSFKFHASCRHTHPAADALQRVMSEHQLTPGGIKKVVAHVHQGAIDVLGPVSAPRSVHQSKFSMPTVLGLIAVFGRAGLAEFDAHYNSDPVAAFRGKVEMQFDAEVDAAYPRRWIGKVTVLTNEGGEFQGRVEEPKGDPGNTLTRPEIEHKALQLARYRNGATAEEMSRLTNLAWNLRTAARLAIF